MRCDDALLELKEKVLSIVDVKFVQPCMPIEPSMTCLKILKNSEVYKFGVIVTNPPITTDANIFLCQEQKVG